MADYFNLILESSDIKLIPLSMQFSENICNNFTAEITKYMWPSAPKQLEEINYHILSKQKEMKEGKEISLVILKQNTNEFLGYVSLHKVNTETPELGIWIKKDAQGQHYGYKAVKLFKDWVDNNCHFIYLSYPVDKRNVPSRKIAEKLGGIVEAEYLKNSEAGNLLDEVEYRFYKKCCFSS